MHKLFTAKQIESDGEFRVVLKQKWAMKNSKILIPNSGHLLAEVSYASGFEFQRIFFFKIFIPNVSFGMFPSCSRLDTPQRNMEEIKQKKLWQN